MAEYELAVDAKRVKDDPLLRVVRLILTIALGACVLAAVILPIAIVAMLVGGDWFVAELAEQGIDASAVAWIAALLALVTVVALLAFFFLRHLRRIVESVSHGNPFAPVNADRLRHMAWLVLAMQLLAIPMTALAIWFDAAPLSPNIHIRSDGISIGALFLALILFVLARVFHSGAMMREELEGTV